MQTSLALQNLANAAPWLPVLHIVHVAASAFMAAIVLLAQFVIYPSFAFKDPARYQAAMQHHQRSIGFIVAPAMLIEGACATLLLVSGFAATSFTSSIVTFAAINLALLITCWLLTFLAIVPLHMRLTSSTAADREALLRTMLRRHWLRTAAWSAHAILACVMLWQACTL
jgi:uncharacterized membrane protein